MSHKITTASKTREYIFFSLITIDFQFFLFTNFFSQESPIHRYLFWVATSVLQLDEASLYASGLALLEQNLHTLDSQGTFDDKVWNYNLQYLKKKK